MDTESGTATKRGAEARERLVNAAADLFWRQGFSATSLAEIGIAAGIPLGNIYYYFRSKAALADAVAAMMEEQMQAALTELAAFYADPRERLLALVELLEGSVSIRAVQGCPIRRAAADFRIPAPDASARAGKVLADMETWLATQLGAAGLSQEEAQNRATEALALWQGGIALAESRQEEGPLLEALTAMRRRLSAPPSDALPV
ncbi:TetR/AcrR family transcriptional regulator [Afifella sp. IM 167]|uniref:TetR/AcrR family transcriptional regulator n=1 Tax=Afifella sp. IM 167 TaxID=2033586 RepID=UPI001CCD8C37|nr:TetR/AcrR family transcriptional regulator [Afifella sp. IM 167]MBZ8135047.1 TetR family transcriptional regulator [Afifella sp. IM 167]